MFFFLLKRNTMQRSISYTNNVLDTFDLNEHHGIKKIDKFVIRWAKCIKIVIKLQFCCTLCKVRV